MIVDGRVLAEKIYACLKDEIGTSSKPPRVFIITCDPTKATEQYLGIKEKKTKALGIETTIMRFTQSHTTEDLIHAINESTQHSDAIIVQLPLPPHIDRDAVIEAVPATHDVDALRSTTTFMSPVVLACAHILEVYEKDVAGQFVTIIGNGRLVGLPLYHWFERMGAHVSVVTHDTSAILEYTKHATIIASGAGVPGLLQPNMIQDGVVILDAGTSEDGGEVRGDADPMCASKASLFTPVPGGIGPLTIAMLLSNVVRAWKERTNVR